MCPVGAQLADTDEFPTDLQATSSTTMTDIEPPARKRPGQGELVERALQQLAPARHPVIDIGVNLMDKSFDKVRDLLLCVVGVPRQPRIALACLRMGSRWLGSRLGIYT
jgi:hypothetical protein